MTTYGFGDGLAPGHKTLTGIDGTFTVPVKVTATDILVLVGAAGRTMQASPYLHLRTSRVWSWSPPAARCA